MKYLLFLIPFLCFSEKVNGQCENRRYYDPLFDGEPLLSSDIVYGSNLSAAGGEVPLKLDIYQPAGDQAASRALVIIAHGGSFVAGSKTGMDAVPLAKDLAKMGYVTASINYRLGMTNFPFGTRLVDSTDAGAAVLRGTHDGRAAVRFFRKNAHEAGNSYRIDTNQIFFLGISAGGFIALHLAYLDELSEIPSFIDTTGVSSGNITGQPGLKGGIEGNSGNSGYSSKVNAVINISGALVDTAWMKKGDTPVLSFHGTNDNTVPYGTDMIDLIGLFPLFEIDGSASVALQADKLGIKNCMITWPGAGHVPEVGTTPAQLAYYDSVLNITRNFLEHFTCDMAFSCGYQVTVHTAEPTSGHPINIYPNPVTDLMHIQLSVPDQIVMLELFDSRGANVKSLIQVNTGHFTMQRDQLPAGIYLMRIHTKAGIITRKLLFE